MNQNPERVIAHTDHDEHVMSRVRGADLIRDQIGQWPDFDDFEIISICLDRSPSRDPSIACDIRAVFYIFDSRHPGSSPERRPGHAEFLFHNVDEVLIEGFNHQNPITGLGIHLAFCPRLQTERLVVEWGGTCMPHEVRFRCSSITVVRVIDLDPFRKGKLNGEPPHRGEPPQ